MFLQYKVVVAKLKLGQNKLLNQFDTVNLNANHDTLKIQKLYTSTYKPIHKRYVHCCYWLVCN